MPDTWHGALRDKGCHDRSQVPAVGSARGKAPTPPAHTALVCWRPEAAPRPGPSGGTRAGAQAHADGSSKRGHSRAWHHGQAQRSPPPRTRPEVPISKATVAKAQRVSTYLATKSAHFR